jgi:hypothetical protein
MPQPDHRFKITPEIGVQISFRLHPKQLIAFRSKATEILYRGPAGGGKPHLMRPPRAGCDWTHGRGCVGMSFARQRARAAHQSRTGAAGLSPDTSDKL